MQNSENPPGMGLALRESEVPGDCVLPSALPAGDTGLGARPI